MKNSSDTIQNQTCDMSACSTVPQPTTPPLPSPPTIITNIPVKVTDSTSCMYVRRYGTYQEHTLCCQYPTEVHGVLHVDINFYWRNEPFKIWPHAQPSQLVYILQVCDGVCLSQSWHVCWSLPACSKTRTARPLLTLFTHAVPQMVDTSPHISAGWHLSTQKTHSPHFGPIWMDSLLSVTCTVMLSVLALHLVECYSSTQVSAGMITKSNAYLYHCHCHSSTVNGFQLYLSHNSILMTVRRTRILIFNVMQICTFTFRI